jgi:transcriptional regulator with XRE-family HTH domain
MNIGTKIRKLRIENKLSQDELAVKLNVAQRSISNFESNKSIPDFLIMQKICDIFQVDLGYFSEENPINNHIIKPKNCNIGCTNGYVNKNSEEVITNLLKRIENLEGLLKK